ncbi:MAG: M48 family metalloprotease, partial [Minisyncoccia bacterium]
MNLYDQRTSNIRRTWALILGFLVLVIAVGYAIAWYYGNPGILYVAVFIAVATNFYAYWESDKLVLSMSHARPALREEFFDFYTVTENLAITAGLPVPKLYVIDDPAPNAFATGRDEKHAVVCATTGLLSILTRPELEGVIGHELSHIQNRDILLMTIAVVLAGFIAIIADIFLRMSFYGGGNRDREGGNGLI